MTFEEFVEDVLSRVLPDGDSARLTDRHKNWVKDCLIDLQRYAVCRQTGHTNEYSYDETSYSCGASTVPAPAGIPTLIKIENTDDPCDVLIAREVTEGVMRGALINTDMCGCDDEGAVDVPEASILTGTYNNDLSIELTCATEGANIFWTTDDGDGVSDFAAYTGPISITETDTTLRFYATKASLPRSRTGSETYTLKVATPVLNPDGMSFYGSTGAVATTGTTGASMRYTTNGDEPTESSTLYSGSISMVATTIIRIRGFKTGYDQSDIESETYTLYQPPTSPVTFSPTDGNFIGTTSVSMATVTPAPYEIRYTTNGTEPNAGSTLYSGPVPITGDTLFKAIAVKTGYESIAANQKQYTQIVPQVEPVTFSPTESDFINTVDVELACATSGAVIRYTLDGSAPNPSSTVYSGPITVTADTTIKAYATKTYYSDATPTMKQMFKVVPLYTYIARYAPDSVFWTDLYPEAALTMDIGDATNLYIEVDGSAATFDFIYGGSPLFGEVAMGADGTDGNSWSGSTTLSGAHSELIIGRQLPIATYPGYFRASGNPFSEVNINVYAY